MVYLLIAKIIVVGRSEAEAWEYKLNCSRIWDTPFVAQKQYNDSKVSANVTLNLEGKCGRKREG